MYYTHFIFDIYKTYAFYTAVMGHVPKERGEE